jgi:hypothetical protein
VIAESITQSAKTRPGTRHKSATATADGAEAEKARPTTGA